MAQSLEKRVEVAYLSQQSAAYIDCVHPKMKYQSSEFKLNEFVKSYYLLDGEKVEITVYPQGKKNKAIFKLGEVSFSGTVAKKAKNINWNTSSISNEFYTDKNIKNLFCEVVLYRDYPMAITRNKLHINMHPHTLYDEDAYTQASAQSYIDNPEYQNVVFLENYDLTYNSLLKNFFKDGIVSANLMDVSLPNTEIPKDIPIVSASAGHAIYRIDVNDLSVVYTGGNINYCILNNFRRLIDKFMQYSEGGSLTIQFDLDGIVAQKGSWMSGARFPGYKDKSIIVKDYFQDHLFAKEFHKTYFDYMIEKHFSYYQRTPLYNKIQFSYNSKDFQSEKKISGIGEKYFKIKLEFINE